MTVTALTMGLRASTGGLDAGNQLGALFHNGEVGAEVGIKHLIKTKHFERSHHLTLDDGAGRHAELLTNGDTGGRCGLHDHMQVVVFDDTQHAVDIVAFADGTGGTPQCTLTAVDTGYIVLDGQGIEAFHALHTLAGLGALATEDALAIIADNGRIIRINGYASPYLHWPRSRRIILLRRPSFAADRFTGILTPGQRCQGTGHAGSPQSFEKKPPGYRMIVVVCLVHIPLPLLKLRSGLFAWYLLPHSRAQQGLRERV